MADRSFKFVDQSAKADNEQLRPSLTYWQDAWRRLKKNKLAMAGLIGVIGIILFGIVGPFFTPYSYEEQVLDHANLPPKFEVTQIAEDEFIFLARDYKMILVDGKGNILRRLDAVDKDVINKIYTYDYNENNEQKRCSHSQKSAFGTFF